MKYLKHTIVVVICYTLFISCNSFRTAIFDQYSLQKTIEIKVDASNLMSKADLSYDNSLEEVMELRLDIQKILEYEKNKPNNAITYAMWQKLADNDKNLLAGFFKKWKEEKILNTFFINEAKIQIEDALNLLISYESKKDKISEKKLLELIKE